MSRGIEGFEEKVLPNVLVKAGVEIFGLKTSCNEKFFRNLLEFLMKLENLKLEVYSLQVYRDGYEYNAIVIGKYVPGLERVIRFESERLNLEVKFWCSKMKGVFYDVFTYPQVLLGEPVITLRLNDLSEVAKGFTSRFGDPGKAILYYLGLDIGKSLARLVRDISEGKGLDLKNRYLLGLSIARSLGWMVAKAELSDEELELTIYDSIDGKVVDEKYDSCYLLKGLLEGYTSNILERKVRGEEVECVKKGYGTCKFKLRLEGEFSF